MTIKSSWESLVSRTQSRWGWTEEAGYFPDITETEEYHRDHALRAAAFAAQQAAIVEAHKAAKRALRDQKRKLAEAQRRREAAERLTEQIKIGSRKFKRFADRMVQIAERKNAQFWGGIDDARENYELEELAWRGRSPVQPWTGNRYPWTAPSVLGTRMYPSGHPP